MEEMPRGLPPAIRRDDKFFWEAAKRGELVIRRCDSCGLGLHPPVPMCPACHGLDWTERKLSGRGKVVDWLLLHHPKTPFFDYPVPVVIVELDEGIQLVSNLMGADVRTVEPGLPVEVVFAPRANDTAVPIFRPLRARSA